MSSDGQPIIVKKVVKGHGGHHGGAWKVAYADFVTAMMAFFLVMWIIGLDSETRRAIEGYFQDPAGFSRTSKGTQGPLMGGNNLSPGRSARDHRTTQTTEQEIAEQERLKQAMRKIRADLQNMPDMREIANNVEMRIDNEGLHVELLEGPRPLFFESGSAAPRPMAVRVFKLVARVLGRLPNNITLEGHTDRHPYTARAGYSNWELSADRANSARRLMQGNGLRPNQVDEVRGYADTRLRVPDNPYHFSNRRVTMLVKFGVQAGKVQLKGDLKATLDQTIRPRDPNIRTGANRSIKDASRQESSAP